jgi:hypothetical protein
LVEIKKVSTHDFEDIHAVYNARIPPKKEIRSKALIFSVIWPKQEWLKFAYFCNFLFWPYLLKYQGF